MIFGGTVFSHDIACTGAVMPEGIEEEVVVMVVVMIVIAMVRVIE